MKVNKTSGFVVLQDGQVVMLQQLSLHGFMGQMQICYISSMPFFLFTFVELENVPNMSLCMIATFKVYHHSNSSDMQVCKLKTAK